MKGQVILIGWYSVREGKKSQGTKGNKWDGRPCF
jgi:hypothetical protein